VGSIEAFILAGFIAGLVVGWLAPTSKLGCLVLLGIPFLALGYVSWWLAENPEIKREQATWAAVYFFGPLWPSVGALLGFYLFRALRDWFRKR